MVIYGYIYSHILYNHMVTRGPYPNQFFFLHGVRMPWSFSPGYIRLRRYDEEPCGYDPYPLQGTACEAGGQVTVRTGHG